jgi:two-component system, NtrC family, response regulator HydG
MNISQVLVVDDDDAVCRIVGRMLSGGEYEVRAADCVAAALKIIDQESFDIYVLDYKLPDGSGLDVAGRIREKRATAPIILMSGYDPSAVTLRAGQLSVTEFLQKPFSRGILCEAVKKAIDSSCSPTPAESDSEDSTARQPLLMSFIPRLDESKVPWRDD